MGSDMLCSYFPAEESMVEENGRHKICIITVLCVTDCGSLVIETIE